MPGSRITLHECRHTVASLTIAAGVNAPEAAGLLDAYLSAQRERVEEAARSAGAVLTGAPTGA